MKSKIFKDKAMCLVDEERFQQEMIESYIKNEGYSRKVAEIKVKNFKRDFPEIYEVTMNKWFDEVHPFQNI